MPRFDDTKWDAAYGPANTSRVPQHTQYVQVSPTNRRVRKLPFTEDPVLWQILFYGKQNEPEYWYERRDAILAAHAISTSDRILVLGAGTGALVYAFHQAGYLNCWGLEPSTFIQGNAARVWGSVILVDADLRGGNQLLSALRKNPAQGGTGADVFNWIIDEEMMCTYEDAELNNIEISPSTRFIDLPELLLDTGVPQSHIIHLVRTVGSSEFVNLHTLAEWVAFDPSHSYMEVF